MQSASPGWNSNNIDWIVSVTLVVGTAVIQAQTKFLFTHSLISELLPEWATFVAGIDWTFTLLLTVALWLLLAGITHITAILMNGGGNFRLLALLWGHGYIPQFIAAAVTFFVFLSLIPDLTEATMDRLERQLPVSDLASHPKVWGLGLMNASAQYLTLCWAIFCVQRVHSLSWVRSTIAVGLPVVVILFFRWLWSIA